MNPKTYSCGICKTIPDQLSHHKSHLVTSKHKDKKELLELKLSQLSHLELECNYKTSNISDIINETETILFSTILKKTIVKNKKKMNQNISDIKNVEKIEIEIIKNKMIEQTNSVSNKEALKDKIHEIHNYLRNNGAGYGMNALKVFNILYGLKKIEENQLLDKVKLKKPDCEFSYLLTLANENKGEQLANIIFGNVLQSIYESELKDLLFYEIPQNIRGSVFVFLIKEMDKITIIEKTCNVLLSGKIYEYFIGRDESAISELGAYFTDRHIVDYILSKLNPSLNTDGNLPTMIDMFGGSGGFTTGYINFLNEKYPQLINWTTEINKIYHFDMNEDVIKSAGLEFFCLTGVLPTMNNLKYKNSFTDEFNGQKFKYPLTNPPYGGDKNNKTEAQVKREKVKEFIKKELMIISDEGLRIRRQKQLKSIECHEKQEKKESYKSKVCVPMCSGRIQKFAKDYGLKGNDKESCSLILLMDIVELGGTAIGVLKEGIFFNKTYKDLRKCLVENFNVREIISIPQDQFENTSTNTSIVIFDNSEEKTKEVKFSDLVIDRYKEDKFVEVFGDIVIIENKEDIVRVSDLLVSIASKEEIIGNSICSLNGKDYNKKDILVGDGYSLVKLGSLCDNYSPTTLLKNEYNYIEISDINENCITNFEKLTKEKLPANAKNIANYGNILISSVRPKKSKMVLITENIKNIENYIFSSALATIKLKDKNMSYYIYCILYSLADNFEKELCNGSSYPRFKPSDLLNISIPIPKNTLKIQEWEDKISKIYNVKYSKLSEIKELENFVQNRIDEIIEKEELEEVELGSVCDIQDGFEFKNNDLTLDKSNIPLVRATYIENNIFSNYIIENSKYNKYKISYGDIIMSQVGNVGAVTKYKETNFGYNKRNAFRIDNKNINKNYLYYYFKSSEFKKNITSNGTIVKFISIPELKKRIIKIPKQKELISKLDETFQNLETLEKEVKDTEELFQNLIQILNKEAFPIRTSL